MRLLYYFLVFVFVAGQIDDSNAQILKENEVVVIKGEKFVLHQVRTGETVYSISKQYNIEGSKLQELNPKIADGLKIGDTLKIPYLEGMEWQTAKSSQTKDPDYFEYYTISSRTETPYFIAREFGIKVEDIYTYNPDITRFRKGTRLKIPMWGPPPAIAASDIKSDKIGDITEKKLILYEVQPGETVESIAKNFEIAESEILFFNPGARDLTPGSIIHLPVTDEKKFNDKIAGIQKRMEDVVAEHRAFFEHTIVSGETMWSVSRKYNVSEFDLKKMNPLLESGFPAGLTIKIPLQDTEITSPEPINEDAFEKHVVQPGETLFRLASVYNLTIPEIRKFNPQLDKRNLVQGETILIPKNREQERVESTEYINDSVKIELPRFEDKYYEVDIPVVIPEQCMPVKNDFTVAEQYVVALFLPLFVEENNDLNEDLDKEDLATDSLDIFTEVPEEDIIIEQEEPEEQFYQFYRESENYLQFYEGVLLAVDSMQREGMNIVLNVFDTQSKIETIRKHIYSEGFLETDLIIGPVFPQVQNEVADLASKNKIPIISPLSAQSNILPGNSQYFQVNPSRDFLIQKTAELISEEYFKSNFVVIKTSHSGSSPEEKVVEMVREKLTPTGYWNNPAGMTCKEVNFNRERIGGLRNALSNEKENVVFVSSMNEGDISVVLSNLNNLRKNYHITLIGFNRYEQLHSIQVEYYHNLNLQYIAPYWVDYSDPATIAFMQKFMNHFNTEPGNFGMQGYDVAFYFLNALKNYGKDFKDCLPYQQVQLVQGSYIFEKQSAFGGYMNQGVSVISYQPDYEVVRRRVIGPLRFARK